MAVKIERETIIGDILDIAPHAAPLFQAIGMHCLGSTSVICFYCKLFRQR